MKIVNVEEMRHIEQLTDAGGHTYAAMMDMAGRAVADTADQLVFREPGQSVLILVGPGNNGGDGLVAARYLLEAGHHLTIYVWRRNVKGDENFQRLKRRRRGMAILWADNDPDNQNLRAELARADLIVDALLGTGVARPLEGRLAELLAVVKEEAGRRRAGDAEEGMAEELQALPRLPIAEAQALGMRLDRGGSSDYRDDLDDAFDAGDYDDDDDDEEDDAGASDSIFAPAIENYGDFDFWDDDDEEEDLLHPRWPHPVVMAVDCPTGLNCDTGAFDPAGAPADITVTFAFPKWGQLQFPGAGACGLLAVAAIGVRSELAEAIKTDLAEPAYIRSLLPLRPLDAHKGTFGKAMIVAGSRSYTGAAYLSGAAATRAGAGLVTLAVPQALHTALAGGLHEVTWLLSPGAEGVHTPEALPPLLERLADYDALLVGPGLSQAPDTAQFVERLFGPGGLDREAWRGRLIADADALNILSKLPDWPARLPPQAILTPHPGEMGRLTGLSAQEINGQRIATAATVGLRMGPHRPAEGRSYGHRRTGRQGDGDAFCQPRHGHCRQR